MLTESEITRSWRKLFTSDTYGDEAFVEAEGLLDELRPESPLRHRLSLELNELRTMKSANGV